MSLFTRIVFLTLCCWCQYGLAACLHPSPQQQIVISQVNGVIAVQDKANNEECQVSNNMLDDEHQGSQLVWIFKDLACGDSECMVELIGSPQMDEKTLKCGIGGPNNSQCRLKVNRLKRLCDAVDGQSPDQCTVNYLIKVRGANIDPSIIIKPRPATE